MGSTVHTEQMCCVVLHQEHLTTIVILVLEQPYTLNKLQMCVEKKESDRDSEPNTKTQN